MHRHRKSVGSIPAGGRIVDSFFSTVPGLNLSCVQLQSIYFIIFYSDPSGPPLQVKFISRTKDSLKLSWLPPDESSRNSNLTGYKVCYSSMPRANSNLLCTGLIRASPYTISNLKHSTKYFVTVVAGTRDGFGKKSSEISQITNGGKSLTLLSFRHCFTYDGHMSSFVLFLHSKERSR